ncbi:hypothetical protein [Paenibacillus gansuensis]|uniref:Uncharacterized protein n=1 Tax=Paenibacillus gansuensis TaxID=306542 RepID=A0ABW5PF78_9BACL
MIGPEPRNERERKAFERAREDLERQALPTPPLDLPSHDVWNWECDLGHMILAMQRAGLDPKKIAEVLSQHEQIKLTPQEAALILWNFKEEKDGA